MQTIMYKAKSPFEIGDKIRDRATGKIHTITDIGMVSYLKSGHIKFLYELNGSGRYVPLDLGTSGLKESFSSTVCREDMP